MKLLDRITVFISALLLGIAYNLHAAETKENILQVSEWNKFVEDLYTLHQHIIKNGTVYSKEKIGGYGGVTNNLEFYREVNHYDSKTDRLISSIKWENSSPGNIHAIEIYIYDDQGRNARDYLASYLPNHRNAPIQTLINIHYYNNKLHSFRQFDASDELLYEYCTGTYNGNPVNITLEDYEIPESISEISEKSQRDAYRACFSQLTNSAGAYLKPLAEL